ncbi:GNAT family N-acetyltransferase [Alteromonas sp. ASW11-130]|uniref:GNAT family N-acetyltransferase n=1 Tax=Alteromonas sp. ASW11-130 TaxID=3015775 RepID=UPI002241FC09|nr:N-acetyltransferase [Alteromonas sp. ASW11-130]MCW8093180.1 N-acetyltransferase [Alteromonas sp. ASW11-130]
MILTIRPEHPEDIPAIREVIKVAFKAVPHSENNEHLIVDALRDDDALTITRVAEEEDKIVGYIAVSPVTLSNGESGWYGIGPLAVSPTAQSRGLGSKLMQSALLWLRENAKGCVLLGEPEFYSQFGFKVTDGLILHGAPPEYFMALSFNHHYPRADITYHPSFYPSS